MTGSPEFRTPPQFQSTFQNPNINSRYLGPTSVSSPKYLLGNPFNFEIRNPVYNGALSPMYYPPPFFNQAKLQKDDHDRRLLDLIEKQTEVIGHLNSKIMNQEQQKILRGRQELKLRLKQLEYSNSLKQREFDARLQNNLLSTNKLKGNAVDNDKKMNQNSAVLKLLSKYVLANEITRAKIKDPRRPRMSLINHAINEFVPQLKEKQSLIPTNLSGYNSHRRTRQALSHNQDIEDSIYQD